MPTPSDSKSSYIFLIVLGLLAIAPFLILNLYNHPAMDDYTFALRDQQIGFWEVQVQFYNNWSGRYFSTTIGRINPMIYHGFILYKWYSFAMLCLLICAIFIFIRAIAQRYLTLLSRVGLVAFILILILVQMPDIAQGMYWFNGYITYIFPFILILFLITFLLKYSSLSKASQLLGILLVIAIIGANELVVIILLSTLLLMLVTKVFYQQQPTPVYLLVLFITAFLLSLVVILAPGNYIRMATQPMAANLAYSVAGAAGLTITSFLKWGFVLLISSLIYTSLWGLAIARQSRNSLLFRCSLPLAIAWFMGTLYMMEFVFLWSTGFRAGTRVENVIYLFFVFGWFYILQLIINKYLLIESKHSISNFYRFGLIAVFCLLVFNLQSNITTAYLDLASGRASLFDKELRARYSFLLNTKCDTCLIRPVTSLPQSLFIFSKLRPDELDEMGINSTFAAYWGKSNISLIGVTPPIQSNEATLKQIFKEWRTLLFGVRQ